MQKFINKNLILTVHFILVIIFAVCIVFLYYYALKNVFNNGLYVISFILFCEGVALALNRGKCPLEYAHRKTSDDKGFFEHFFPAPIVPYVIPAVCLITTIGFILLYF